MVEDFIKESSPSLEELKQIFLEYLEEVETIEENIILQTQLNTVKRDIDNLQTLLSDKFITMFNTTY